jgi:hypothetical protein
MTSAQTLRREGFLASLEVRGVELSFNDGSTTTSFEALVEPFSPEEGEFSAQSYEREASNVHVLREAVPSGIVIGSFLTHAAEEVRHRVTEIRDDKANICVVFTCETAPYTPPEEAP